jgi:low affinity Fe/Cu permease
MANQHEASPIMKLNKYIYPFSIALMCAVMASCATSNNVTSEVAKAQTEEQKIDEQLKEIYVSEEAKVLVTTETNEEDMREELVCKREAQIGTKFKKKVCYTKSELEAKRKAAKKEADELQRQRSLGEF